MSNRTTWILVFSAAVAGVFLGYMLGAPSRSKVRSLQAEAESLKLGWEAEEILHVQAVERLRRLTPRDISEDCKTLLSAAVVTGAIVDGEPSLIRAGNTTMTKPSFAAIRRENPAMTEEEIDEKRLGHQREYARWRAALDELSRRGFVDFYSSSSQTRYFRVTQDGYDYLERK